MNLYTFFSGLTDDKDKLESILSDIYDYCPNHFVQIISTEKSEYRNQGEVMYSIIGQTYTDSLDAFNKAFGNYHWYWFDAELATINNLEK